MADFGWAFVKGNLVTGSAPPSGAVQYNDGSNKFAASGDFVFVSGATSQLNLTGNLDVVGDVSASVYYGDGSNLTGVGGTPGGSDTQLQFNSGSAFSGSSNLTYDYTTNTLTLSGTLNISGTLATNELVVNVENRNVINISATGSTQFGDSTDDTHVFTGSMSISGASNPLNLKGLQIGTLPNTSSYLAIDSSNNVILTPVSNGVIGEAEDGDYTDGLFADFLASTPIGTAIDKFNEILKIIVPGPAPAVDRINYTNTAGIGLKIGEATSSYTSVSNTGSYSDSLGVSSEYSSSTSGEDFRLGTYDGSQQITGTINFHVSEQLKSTEINYSNNAFGNAESGSLKLYVNGALAHTLDLDGFVGTGSPNSGSATDFALGTSTGFIEISTTGSATDQNGSEYSIFQHRTAKFVIDTPEQRDGWNIAKVEHEYGGTTYITNFVQWYNDPDASSQAMAAQNQSVTFTGHGPAKYLSGVEYYRSGTLEYTAEATNFYKYTYPTGSVLTFNKTSNLDPIAAQTPADISISDTNALVRMTASAETNNDVILNDSATISFNLTHPFKTNLSATGSVTTNGILIYNVDTASSNLVENFDDETYRLVNASWDNQSEVASPTDAWDSQNHMTSSGATGHTDGLLFYNGKLYSPNQGSNSGDFSTLANGPASNPDYSSTTGTRTFFRKIQNLTGVTKYDLKISSTKNTKINNTTLTTDNVKFYIKLPGTSGWMDISQNFSYGNISDGDGALISGASVNDNTSGTSTSNAVHCVTFGTAPVLANQYVVIKIEADASWTKYIDDLTFQFGASDVSAATNAPVLDDIDLADTAGVDAKLSFGTSNTLTDYSNVTGSSISASLSTVNINGLYSDNSDTRRGVFSSFEAMGGTLNQDVEASGQNYTADSFFNGYAGSLVLEVNGTEVSSIDLTSTLSTINNISTDTGFSVSAVSFSKTSDLIPDYNKPYRTGTYSIGVSLQNSGWNYARVIHRVGATNTETNYVEWVVDPSGSTSMSFSNVSLTDFGHTDVYYQSGIGYFASRPTGSYSYVLSGAYSNVYSNDSSAISFPTTTNCSITNIDVNGDGVTNKSVSAASTSYPALDSAVPGCESTDIQVTGTVLFDDLTSIIGDPSIFTSRDATISSRALHPLKSLVNVSSQSKSDFMVFSGSLGSTNLNTQEYFGLETYRVVSGNYANQSDVTSSSNAWDSTISMNDTASYAEYADGMVTIDGYAITPLRIGNNGDTRNVSDGGVAQAPSGNPDYSTLNENIRTYYRYFRNETGLAKATFTVTLYGDANLISKSGAFYTGTLGANKNIQVELKVPYDPAFTGLDDTSTAWGDCIKPYELGTQPTSDGVGIFNGGGGDLNQTVGSGGTSVAIQLQGSQVRDDQYYVLKISAHEDWTGYLSRIAITY